MLEILKDQSDALSHLTVIDAEAPIQELSEEDQSLHLEGLQYAVIKLTGDILENIERFTSASVNYDVAAIMIKALEDQEFMMKVKTYTSIKAKLEKIRTTPELELYYLLGQLTKH
jgi:hypothetical protein